MDSLQHTFRNSLTLNHSLKWEPREIDKADETLAGAMTDAYHVIETMRAFIHRNGSTDGKVAAQLEAFERMVDACQLLGRDFHVAANTLLAAISCMQVQQEERVQQEAVCNRLQ